MNEYKRFSAPYDAFVHRAWKAAVLTGAEQYVLLSKDGTAAQPAWAKGQPCFFAAAAALSFDPPYSALTGTFCDAGPLPTELTQQEFSIFLATLAPLVPTGSTLVFRYDGQQYSYREMEQLLSSRGFLIYEHLDEEEIRDQFLLILTTRRPFVSIRNHRYCLAVKYREIQS